MYIVNHAVVLSMLVMEKEVIRLNSLMISSQHDSFYKSVATASWIFDLSDGSNPIHATREAESKCSHLLLCCAALSY